MNITARKPILHSIILIASLIAPWLMPAYQTQLAFLWVMVVFALTWDIVGGQMGYNSFGNIVFFGLGMYATAVVQRNMHFDIEEYVHVAGRVEKLTQVLTTKSIESLTETLGEDSHLSSSLSNAWLCVKPTECRIGLPLMHRSYVV